MLYEFDLTVSFGTVGVASGLPQPLDIILEIYAEFENLEHLSWDSDGEKWSATQSSSTLIINT